MKVQEALKAAVEAMELANISCEHFHHEKKHQHLYGEKCIPEDMWKDALELCKSALSDIEKCEPVYLIVSGADEIVVTKEKYDSWSSAKRISYTSPQPIEKCEPVAEALHERNRLGYAVVDVIGALDEIIENAQEVEVDDFLHIAIPIDKWHELQDALEEMPKRAELYTSPISKEWVGLTKERIEAIVECYATDYYKARAIERELKQLNAEKG